MGRDCRAQRPVVLGLVCLTESCEQRAIVELNGCALDNHHLVAAFEVHDERRVGLQVAGGNRLGVRREEDLPVEPHRPDRLGMGPPVRTARADPVVACAGEPLAHLAPRQPVPRSAGRLLDPVAAGEVWPTGRGLHRPGA
jgi:hypothetical protein